MKFDLTIWVDDDTNGTRRIGASAACPVKDLWGTIPFALAANRIDDWTRLTVNIVVEAEQEQPADERPKLNIVK